MERKVIVGIAVAGLVALGAGSGFEATAASTAKASGRAVAVVRTPDYESSEMRLIERQYVDGVAYRLDDGAAVLLSATPMDACTRLAVLLRGSTDFSAFTSAAAPALAVVRNAEYPQGNVLFVEQGSTTYLSQSIPSLQTEGERFIAKGKEMLYGTEGKPSLEFDIDLPYSSTGGFAAVAADGGPEAAWLRGLAKQAAGDAEAVVAATFQENEEDWNSYAGRSTWFDVLSNWGQFSVVAAASEADCATLVVRTPGFSGGWQQALIRARGPADQRKVYAAESSDDHGGDDSYFVGRVEHPTLGTFPIVDARARAVADVGTEIIFSDKPIGDAGWEQLVTKQRAVRALASVSFGDSYMLSTIEFAGPGTAVDSVPAGSISNAHIDNTSIAGLIRQGGDDGRQVVANFRLALPTATASP